MSKTIAAVFRGEEGALEAAQVLSDAGLILVHSECVLKVRA